MLYATAAPHRYAGASFIWSEAAPPATTDDWQAVAEAAEAPGLIVEPGRIILHAGGLGLVDLYYTKHGDAVYFASRIEPLLAIARQTIDWAAWAAIFRLGCPLGEATPFTDVKRLPGSVALIWSRDSRRLSVDRRVHRSFAIERPSIRVSAAGVNDLLDALGSALDAWANRPMALPLSGGWDSRLLAGLASGRGFDVDHLP